jgi:hypothetical protein
MAGSREVDAGMHGSVREARVGDGSKWRKRLFIGRTFGIPSLCCPGGRLDESSANARCSGSGMRAGVRSVT